MPRIHLNLYEFFESHSDLRFKREFVIISWPRNNGSFPEMNLWAGDVEIGSGDFMEVNGYRDTTTIKLRGEYWDKYLPEIVRVVKLYEAETGITVDIERW